MKSVVRLALVGAVGLVGMLCATPSAGALPATRTICVGHDLYIFTSEGGTGVIYDSVRCA